MKIVVIGGGAAGLGAAGSAKGAAPEAEVVVYTEFEDVAYSPCGIPFVHGKEIDSFDRLFLATKEQYVKSGIDVHYETTVESIDLAAKTLEALCAEQLSDYKVPESFTLLTQPLPRNANGKLLKRTLREQVAR